MDLIISLSIETVHVIPGDIDPPRFLDALSRTLSVYPLAAGRFERPSDTSDGWKIRLTKSGVPVKFLENHTEQIMPSTRVIQNQGVASLVEKVDIDKILEPHSDEPLARFTMVKFVKTGLTAIGFSQYHTIGDGFIVIQFLRLLSQTYQGLLPLDPSPSYSSHYSPLHATSTYPQESLMTPHLESPFPMGGKPPFMGRHKGEISRVDIHFRVETIEQIHKAVTLLANENTDEGSRSVAFSKQDTLIALLARASTKSDPRNAIQHIINFFMYRGIGSTSPTAVGNANLGAIAFMPKGASSNEPIEYIVRRVRQAITQVREPEFLEVLIAKVGDLALRAADANMLLDITPPDGIMAVNSTWRFDWTSAHFGHPGRTQFYHTMLLEPRFIKIVQPNPIRLADGTYQSFSGDAEVTLCVLKKQRELFTRALHEEMGGLHVEGMPEVVIAELA
ncbi:unnamed protein product [Somion occarium]